MRIGHVTYNYKPIMGGQEVYVDSLVKILREAGHRQRIYQREGGESGESVIEVPRVSNKLPLLLSFNLGLLARRPLLKEEDLLIINYPEAFPFLCWHRNTVVISHGSTWTRRTSRRSKMARKFLARFAFQRATQFVANDTFVLREMGLDVSPRQGMFQEVSPGKWFVPNCVDVGLFAPRQGLPELKEKNPIIVPRNLTYSRGVDLAVSAYASFREKHPDTSLVIIGDAIPGVRESEEFKEKLLSQVKSLGLDSKVFFLGRLAPAEMPEVYSSALFTLIPTRCSEGTSLSALESMACGTPVISTDVEGLLDLPTLKCEATVESLADAMERVFKQREELGRSQRKQVAENYNLANWQRAWMKVVGNRY